MPTVTVVTSGSITAAVAGFLRHPPTLFTAALGLAGLVLLIVLRVRNRGL
jgi:hypothetical protein